jgi:hypothetical protein
MNRPLARLRVLALGALLGGALVLPSPAAADEPVWSGQPDAAECWGTVVEQRATTYHDIGEHSSAQDEPRIGVGNLAHLFGGIPGDAGSFLASVDDLAVTTCS